ncbi:carbohydrate binding domain-containing protein [Paenibacillus sp. EC2-1]|uniref:carbohydrate binding domain-containing protein n=1 Tax=Paenibacillus sp. EC2-1 TaxID=3388665 RepID=UPI003BEF1626
MLIKKMKGRQFILCCLIMVLLTGSFGTGKGVRAEGGNLLNNSGFEQVYKEEEPEGWSVYTNQTQRPGVVHDLQHVYEGEKAAYIVPASSLTFNLTKLKTHTNYTFKAYVKLSDASATAKLGAKLYDGNQPDIAIDASGTTYKSYTVTFTTGNQTTAQVYLWSSNGLSGNQKAYLDSVTVTETANTSGTNLVTNAGFEKVVRDLRPVSWRIWPSEGDMPGTVSDPSLVHAGNRAGYIPSVGSLNYDLTGLKRNTSYKFSAFLKMSDLNAGAVLGVKVNGQEMKKPVSGTTYARHEIIFNTGNQTSATVYLWSGDLLAPGQRAYIDETMVEEYIEQGSVRVSLNMSELLLTKGYTYPLLTEVAPANAPNKSITYQSNDPSVATVDANGVITAIGAGTATISAIPAAGGNTATTAVTVTNSKEPWYPGRSNTEWVLTKEDDFNGTELDTNLWSVRGKEYAVYHRDDMVSVSDGKLKLKIEREPDGNIVLGRVDTHGEDRQTNDVKFDQKYGFFEVSAKIPPTEKTYFTFWAFNYPGVFHVDGTGKDGLEIDVTETVWQGDYTETALHWDGYDAFHKSTGSGKKPAPNIHKGFHVYGFEWSEDYLKFYFDGKLTWTYTDKANIPWVKEIFILSSGWARSPGWGEGDINNAQLPYFSEIDWFRAYEKKIPSSQPDTTAPILYGTEDIQIPLNSSTDLLEKVFAIDNRDDREEITSRIQLDETGLNRSVKGEYQVTYGVQDLAGNQITKTRKVTVVDKSSNLIYNGNFDQGSTNGWDLNLGTAEVKQNIDLGKYASLNRETKMQQSILIKPNTSYKVTFSGKSDVKSNLNQFRVGVEYGSGQVQENVTKSEWGNYTLSFTTGPEDCIATFFADNQGPDKASIDTISVIPNN